MEILKISTKSKPSSIAGALANAFKVRDVVEMQTVGAGAINQGIKGIAIARGYVAPSGYDLVCTPAFSSVDVDGESKTAMKLIVEIR